MSVAITGWTGRLGNNIIQVKHALHLALYYKYNVTLPPHSYFNTRYIKLYEEKDDKPVMSGQFFGVNRIDRSIFRQNNNEVREILRSIFTIMPKEPIGDDTLVIHIRGGDICSGRCRNGNYTPPPFIYYKSIITTLKPEKIIILSEDTTNPCTNAILREFDNATFTRNTLDNDLKTLLSAKYVIESIGTFTTTLLYISNCIKHIYRPNYQFTWDSMLIEDYTCPVTCIDLSDYHNKQGEWSNSNEQRDRMISYTFTTSMPVSNEDINY